MIRVYGAHERISVARERRGGQAMMRLARSVSLLVAFSLLTSAAKAYAECAWVLWAAPITPSGNWSIPPVSQVAFSGRAECERVAEAEKDEQFKRLVAKEKGLAQGILKCLPDTVDPARAEGEVSGSARGVNSS
jgi:hypothetical protein